MPFNKDVIKNLFNKICNPLLFYVDKSGNSVFRNYCIFRKNGYLYSETFDMPDAGKALEYRMQLDKHLRTAGWIITFLIYLVLIHTKINFWTIILAEIIWVLLFFAAKMVCAQLYSKFLFQKFGRYTLCEFSPEISEKKEHEYHYGFYSKITKYAILILLFFIPAFLITGVILEALDLYDPIVEFGKAGATVPIVGFGRTLAKGVINAVTSSGINGVFAGGLTATATGIGAAVFFSFIFALIFNSHTKKS